MSSRQLITFVDEELEPANSLAEERASGRSHGCAEELPGLREATAPSVRSGFMSASRRGSWALRRGPRIAPMRMRRGASPYARRASRCITRKTTAVRVAHGLVGEPGPPSPDHALGGDVLGGFFAL